jgi:hypothetical protein
MKNQSLEILFISNLPKQKLEAKYRFPHFHLKIKKQTFSKTAPTYYEMRVLSITREI